MKLSIAEQTLLKRKILLPKVIRYIEHRQGLKIACLEEIAFNLQWIDSTQVLSQASKYKNSPYGKYLKELISNNN